MYVVGRATKEEAVEDDRKAGIREFNADYRIIGSRSRLAACVVPHAFRLGMCCGAVVLAVTREAVRFDLFRDGSCLLMSILDRPVNVTTNERLSPVTLSFRVSRGTHLHHRDDLNKSLGGVSSESWNREKRAVRNGFLTSSMSKRVRERFSLVLTS